MAQLKRKRITKKEIEDSRRLAGLPLKKMACKQCGRIEKKVSPDAVSVICSICVTKMVPLPEGAKPKPPEERRPRGWQFMKEYRAPDGVLYRRGVKVDESEPIQPTKAVASGTRKRASNTKSSDKNSRGKGGKDRASGTKQPAKPTKPAKSVKRAGTKKSASKRTTTKRRTNRSSK